MKRVVFLSLFVFGFLFESVTAQKIQNMDFEQVNDKLVITYKLDSPANISVFYAQGKEPFVEILKAKGDVGKNVSSGSKRIEWFVLNELPNGLMGELSIKVVANPIAGAKKEASSNNMKVASNTQKKQTSSTQNSVGSTQMASKKDLEFEVKGVKFKMVYVNGGEFEMGCSLDHACKSKPAHKVKLTDYYIGEFEVTQELWEAVMGSNPSSSVINKKCPVDNVSWEDCQSFISRLNKLTNKKFALPSEAQWEYAARGGNKGGNYKFSGSYTAGNVAWVQGSGTTTHPVGTKNSNELGIYDMSGNVYEWCQDWYVEYESKYVVNPLYVDVKDAFYKVQRGGSYNSHESYSVVTRRKEGHSKKKGRDCGLRLMLQSN